MSFQEQLAHGRIFEEQIDDWFQGSGWYTSPKYSATGDTAGPPALKGQDQNIILTDLLVCKGGSSIWVEAKDKERMRSRDATGFNFRLYCHYRYLAEESGFPVFVIFRDQGQLYGNWLENMSNHIYAKNFQIQGKQHILFQVPQAFYSFTWETKFDQLLEEIREKTGSLAL